MDFLAANRLVLLLAVVALAVVYAVLQLRNRKYEVRFTNLALLDVVAPKRPGWRRHATAVAFLLAASVLVLAFAQPVRDVKVPKERATVVLAIDTSLSMDATDVAPTRLKAAQAAAGQFLDAVPDSMNVGLVTFDGVARVQVTPTTDRELIRRAISNLTLHESTAIGEAIFLSLDAIKAVPPAPDGKPAPARIVLMSDGKTTVGRANADAGAAAEKARVPITTIAFGTPDGEIHVNDDPLPVLVPVEPGPLRDLARQTSGKFFEADSVEGLGDVYKDIGSSIGYTTEQRDISAWFVGAALVALLLSAALSLVWFARLPDAAELMRLACAALALVLAGAACSDGGGDGDLAAFCTEVDRLSTNDPFASFGDTAEPAEMRTAFRSLVERAGQLADPAPTDIRGAADRYETATEEIDRILAAAGYDGRKVDVVAYGNAQTDYDDARGQISAFAARHCS